jgi:hypothetical protein
MGARTVGIDAVPVQQLVAIHVADPGDHRLVHQQRTNRSAGLGDSCPGPGAVGIATQRVRAEFGHHVGDLGLLDHFTHRRAA